MKALVISHSCVVDVNQQVFVCLNDRPDMEVALLIPARWKSEYTGEMFAPRLLPEVRFPVFTMPVAVPGHVSLHFYRRLPMTEIRAFRPDVLLSTQEPWSLSNLQAMWLADRFKIPFAFQTNQNLFKKYPSPFSWIEQTAYRRAVYALAYSEEARQVMLKKGLTGASQVVPYATDTRRFVPQDSSSLRRQLELGDAIVIGYMGRLVPEKGLDTLIDAFALLRQDAALSGVPLRLLLIGSGMQEEALKRRADTLGIGDAVVFAGAVPHSDAARYLACMDIFALPSRTTPHWKEQFGRVIIEALACGIPVVGSDSGQIPHLIQETGGGLVFREGDPQELAKALASLVHDSQERTRLARQGQQIVHERFTCEAVARQLHELFLKMTTGRATFSTTGAAANR